MVYPLRTGEFGLKQNNNLSITDVWPWFGCVSLMDLLRATWSLYSGHTQLYVSTDCCVNFGHGMPDFDQCFNRLSWCETAMEVHHLPGNYTVYNALKKYIQCESQKGKGNYV